MPSFEGINRIGYNQIMVSSSEFVCGVVDFDTAAAGSRSLLGTNDLTSDKDGLSKISIFSSSASIPKISVYHWFPI